jgi:hypothetical protein
MFLPPFRAFRVFRGPWFVWFVWFVVRFCSAPFVPSEQIHKSLDSLKVDTYFAILFGAEI